MGNFTRRQILGSVLILPFGFGRNCEREAPLRQIQAQDLSQFPEDVRALIAWTPAAELQYITFANPASVAAVEQIRAASPSYLASGSANKYHRGATNTIFESRLALKSANGEERFLWWLSANGMRERGIGVFYGNAAGVTALRLMWDGFSSLNGAAAKMNVDIAQSDSLRLDQWRTVISLGHDQIGQAMRDDLGSVHLRRMAELLAPPNPQIFEDRESQQVLQDRIFGRN